MAYVALDANNNVTVIFGLPQISPTPPGYAIIDDADPRVIDFQNKMAAGRAAVAAQSNALSFLQFLNLFTPAEQTALVNSTDTQTKLFLLMAAGSGQILLNDSAIVQGVNHIASIGIIAQSRISQILAGQSQ